MCAQFALQGGPSVSPKNSCKYRGPNNRKCAIGAIMPDELYDPKFESTPVSRLSLTIVSEDETMQEFLNVAQHAHDMHAWTKGMPGDMTLKAFKESFILVAERYSLNPAAISTITKWEV
jgi:hypothetical protein